MSSTGLAPRGRSGYALRKAAKERRQKVLAIVLGVILVIVAAYEIPNTLHKLNKSSAPESAATPAATPTTPAVVPQAIPKSLQRATPSDPFSASVVGSSDPGVGSAIVAGRDPFAETAPPAAAPTQVSSSPLLPEKIVIGSPGGGRVAQHGWIVILASIPTGQGRDAAVSFASRARGNGIGSLSILNSSNRRPLRGGYWVVYDGPYQTLAQVSGRASVIHASGYSTAYIRELIVYR
jgi:hypothetical protein